MGHILLVDDDQALLVFVQKQLESAGYIVRVASNGAAALSVLGKESFDLAIVDVMMPYVDGFELVRKIRETTSMPIILLTAKAALEDKEKGFRLGTDDYVVKPFEIKELLFRIQALLRRAGLEHAEASLVPIGKAIIDQQTFEVRIDSKTLLLPLKEFELLLYLASHVRRVCTRDELIDQVWGLDFSGDERTVDVHIKRLRQRFPEEESGFRIKTLRGVGYSLEVTER
ncbi:response regulator transcription factor [Paenisporosarcina cavernae]|uniref:Heme response regulator HssR n=1 Tax=Paenisporosarcina cavernae TaxID=2320858 RepID=A0A385YPF4_9BACL|nr:response regulator transcription factor [Paenisporosarcina cavernae]AYC28476.1 DNA-binding response regulator [Paenisporosarcina cavernae]